MYILAPSLLGADFSRLEPMIRATSEAGGLRKAGLITSIWM